MSMTDEQIVKALEICNSLSQRCGDGCPYYTVIYKKEKRCSEMMIDDTLALIKRQQAEIESLEADYENVYKQASADLLASIADGGTSCEWCIDKHRAEAVREFAEFLIDKAENNVIRIGDLCDYVIDFNEMTEKEGGVRHCVRV